MAEVDYMGTVSGYRVPDKFEKAGMIFYESFNNQYFSLGEKAGNAWMEGRKFM